MPPYAQRLEQARLRAGLSKRALALAISERTGRSPDVERRALYKYIDGAEPEPDRAAILALILNAPELALVQAPADRRRGRLEALEAEVAALRMERDQLLARVLARLDALEAAQATRAQRTTRRTKGTAP